MLIFTFFSMPAFAQEEGEEEIAKPRKIDYHSMGDQVFGINAGFFIPLFFQNPNDGSIASTNLSLGGNGSLYYGAYLNNNFQVGMEIGAMFSSSPNDNNFYMIPITLRATYELQFLNNLISVPLYIGYGVNMTSYQDNFNVEMIFKPGFGVFWNQSASWSFGVNTTYWWVPQLYSDPDDNRFGNFLDVSLSAVYHF